MRHRRASIAALMALLLVMLNCGQCAVGADISQNITIGTDVACATIAVAFFCIMAGLTLLGGGGAGFGGREG